MATATTSSSYTPRVIGKPEPQPKQINLWLGSSVNAKNRYCATCGGWHEPTKPYSIFVDTLKHSLCHGCATTLTPLLAGMAAMAQNDPAKLRRQIKQTTGVPIGVIPYVEAVIETPAYEEMAYTSDEPVYTDAEYAPSNIGEDEEKAQNAK